MTTDMSRHMSETMDRDERFMQGYRYAIKAAVTYIHAQADRMNHPPAKAALNVAATGLGFHLREPEKSTENTR